jgi:antitoxin component YwqK of YwqJK toxin-antitoxin module
MKYRKQTIFLLFIFFLLLAACAKKDEEVVIKTYRSGEKKETALLREEGQKKFRIKSFEYYKTGEKKREYNYRNNKYFGPWTYWYKDGSVIAEGMFDEETTRPGKSIGSAVYSWPNGEKMLFIKVIEEGEDSNITEYYEESGKSYTDDTIPDDLKEKIREVITDWTKGKI